MSLQNVENRSQKVTRKLTNDRIARLKVGNLDPATKQIVSDNQKIFGGAGLFVQVSKTGRKVFRYKYYVPGKHEKCRYTAKVVTIGDFDPHGDGRVSFTLEQAEAKYRMAMAAYKNEKIDPQEIRNEEILQNAAESERKNRTFKVCAEDWLKKQIFTAAHLEKVVSRLFKDCYPIIGETPVDEVSRQQIQKIIDVIVDRGAVDTARRVVSWLAEIFDEALFNGFVAADPTAGIKKRLPKVSRGKFKAVTDTEKFRDVLNLIETIPAGVFVKTALRLLPHVFVRQMELRHAKWKDIDLDAGIWKLCKAKKRGRSIADNDIEAQAKDYIVPLSRQVVAMLRDLKPYTTGSEFVFPGNDSLGRPISNMTLGRAFKRAGVTETTPHGFRSTFKTLATELFDIEQSVTEHMLSHSATTDKYGYFRASFLPQRRALAQIWSDYIDQLRTGKPDICGLKNSYQQLVSVYKGNA